MKKSSTLPGFWSSLRQSFHTPDFYKKALTFPFGKVVVYLLLLSTLGYVIFVGKSAAMLYQNRAAIQEQVQKISDSFPADLQLTFKDGQLSTNAQQPFFLPTDGIGEKNPTYLAVIDTTTPYSPQQFTDYDAVAWLTKDTLYLKNTNEVREYPYPQDFNQTVTKATALSFLQTLWDKVKVPLLIGALFVLVAGNFGLFLFNFVYLAIIALIYLFFSQVSGKKHDYGQCFRIATYAFTPVWILSLVVQVLGLAFPLAMPPFLFSAVLFATIILNVYRPARKES